MLAKGPPMLRLVKYATVCLVVSACTTTTPPNVVMHTGPFTSPPRIEKITVLTHDSVQACTYDWHLIVDGSFRGRITVCTIFTGDGSAPLRADTDVTEIWTEEYIDPKLYPGINFDLYLNATLYQGDVNLGTENLNGDGNVGWNRLCANVTSLPRDIGTNHSTTGPSVAASRITSVSFGGADGAHSHC
jgi:hypothetical protein